MALVVYAFSVISHENPEGKGWQALAQRKKREITRDNYFNKIKQFNLSEGILWKNASITTEIKIGIMLH